MFNTCIYFNYGDGTDDAIFISCGTTTSAESKITNFYIDLDPEGGIITMLFYAGGYPDKMEISHGLPLPDGSNKVATSSIGATGNYGPFDQAWGNPPGNDQPPNQAAVASIPQFVGTNKQNPFPDRRTQYTADTGSKIPSMVFPNPDYGAAFQQVVWWKYDSTDYVNNPLAVVRVISLDSTSGYAFYRLCTIYTKVIAAQCGQTLANITDLIEAYPVAGATIYEFEVTSGAGTFVSSESSYTFDLYTKTPGGAQYNTAYTIRVRYLKVGSTFSPWGDACVVTTPTI